ncbi:MULTISPECIES: AzlC family ABC transporter permease [Paraburkholderia]|uniref:4-azaleucine resistance probable transporter AzlC n=1 Tax=Paraburkholderia tropica TaxID=92647 RepID=A0A1A5X212_9BURK|nr:MULTISPECIES: AzlC family ABC transporter permease [Paraburkholderia]MBB2984107.1 4-azaleucine resistance transporter AzlC [Paraburkholderia tropica]MDE1139149.1 AzlC family ABC transporter permease [Paraburkholderia tropica]OBR47160.1 branched-chain amino acid ABC transporter permease [Paraburkholderia tropica]PXX19594.1 4-azaleucine resistance transporter AzlC [Paraburkholderia tropica]PZW88535.1 4-azaleucine resistance transporter AzlC [Paraburkholderia tropica]
MSSLYSPSMASRGSQVRAEMARGMRAALPVMLGFVPFALVLGAQAAQKGLSVLEVPMMTGMNFAGGSEFTAVRLWTSPPHIALIVLMSLLVNARHILMGAALAPRLRHVPLPRALAALFLMCDESWALALADANGRKQDSISLAYYLGAAVNLWLTWVAFTALGAVLGPVLGDVERYGFDMAFTAVFLVLLKGMWKGARASSPWFVSLVVAGVTYRLVPGAWYVAAGACAGLLAAVAMEKRDA